MPHVRDSVGIAASAGAFIFETSSFDTLSTDAPV